MYVQEGIRMPGLDFLAGDINYTHRPGDLMARELQLSIGMWY